jgi:hypothetical protein
LEDLQAWYGDKGFVNDYYLRIPKRKKMHLYDLIVELNACWCKDSRLNKRWPQGMIECLKKPEGTRDVMKPLLTANDLWSPPEAFRKAKPYPCRLPGTQVDGEDLV